DTAYLHIVNLTLRKGTITSQNGSFTIPVRINDTLFVSAIQFQHKEIVITPDIFSRKHISFYLEEEISQLDEVNISDIDLSGRLGDDLSIPKVEKPFNPADAGLPVYTGPTLTDEERKLYTATHTGGGIIPIDPIVNMFSGRTKMLKQRVKISKMESRVQKARNKVLDSVYINTFKIPANLIDDFAHFVFENNNANLALVSRNDPLALMELLLVKAPEYRKHKEID
ncbi:MAG: hypothetical protein V7767_08475, partial [Leeuwenhoekiella sp.]